MAAQQAPRLALLPSSPSCTPRPAGWRDHPGARVAPLSPRAAWRARATPDAPSTVSSERQGHPGPASPCSWSSSIPALAPQMGVCAERWVLSAPQHPAPSLPVTGGAHPQGRGCCHQTGTQGRAREVLWKKDFPRSASAGLQRSKQGSQFGMLWGTRMQGAGGWRGLVWGQQNGAWQGHGRWVRGQRWAGASAAGSREADGHERDHREADTAREMPERPRHRPASDLGCQRGPCALRC